jgi:hypothetical protein
MVCVPAIRGECPYGAAPAPQGHSPDIRRPGVVVSSGSPPWTRPRSRRSMWDDVVTLQTLARRTLRRHCPCPKLCTSS